MEPHVWVFGYGSLIWRPDFPFLDSRRAGIDGWSRRFWQGSDDHRGVPGNPGRVLTLIRAPEELCIGCAFLVEREVLGHIDYRERNGYSRYPVEIQFDDGTADGIVYIAPPSNPAFLGEAPVDQVIAQILQCRGASGTNLEYLLELARELRQLRIHDPHIAELEQAAVVRMRTAA